MKYIRTIQVHLFGSMYLYMHDTKAYLLTRMINIDMQASKVSVV